MIGLLIISHCELGKELLNAAELIFGRLEAAKAISITQTTESEELLKIIAEDIKALDFPTEDKQKFLGVNLKELFRI